ncbi:MAG: hypothetical protein J0L67_01020 [Cytophagales bacterium]|nr:hypothetical protein [Cytophagales bacterium]
MPKWVARHVTVSRRFIKPDATPPALFTRVLHGNFMQIYATCQIKAPFDGCFNGGGKFNLGHDW